MTEEELIAGIRMVRRSNNDLWMEVLEIALKADPARTKAALRGIRENDLAIYDLMEDLTK